MTRRPDAEVQARIEELRKLEAECIKSYLQTHIVQHLLLIPEYHRERRGLEWSLSGGEE